MRSITDLWHKLLQNKKQENIHDKIAELINNSKDYANSLSLTEKNILKNLLKAKDITVESVMIPRIDIQAIPLTIDTNNVIKELESNIHSRWPVYQGTLDEIRGFVHIKDVAKAVAYKNFDCRQILEPIIFVPKSFPMMDLLSQMRQKQTPISIVVDEYGGTDGLVTSWNILQQILGDIAPQENEEEQPRLELEASGSYLSDARVTIEELEQKLEIILIDKEQRDEIDTVGGLILFLAGRVPSRREIIEYKEGIEFEILESTPRSIVTVRISRKK